MTALAIDDGVYSESLPLADLLVRSARRHPDDTALVLPGSSFSYAELLDRSVAVARGLVACGVGLGDKVGLLAPNGPEFVESFFGAALAGAVLVPLNARHRSTELSYIIGHAEIAAILSTDALAPRTDFASILTEVFPELEQRRSDEPLDLPLAPHLRRIVMLRGESAPGILGRAEFDALAQQVTPDTVGRLRCRVRVRDDAMIIYTSGTTSNPKGCVLSHEAVTRGPVGRTTAAVPFEEPREERVLWCPAPLFHIAALQGFIFSVAKGITFLTDLHLDGARAWHAIRRHRATSLWPMFMPAMNAVLETDGFDASQLDHVSSMITVGAPSELRALQALFPKAVLVNGSGMSEMTGHFCLSPRDDSTELRATTSGRPVAGAECRVIDPVTGADLPDGELGELLVRGYSMMTRYHRDPGKTAEAIDTDGFLHTGDLFRRYPSGHFRYEGRLKDMLKVGGENVPPAEVEEYLCSHPAVLVAQVVGRPDARLEEVPVAFVQVQAGVEVTAEDLMRHCRGSIASFKVPRAVYFKTAEQWPMSATKISKVALRREAAERLHEPA
jgi:acyl-CoA synthetase (AMP-forming)/AMP-acid ligase II